MSYIEKINQETILFIQKSAELILQFRDFDRNIYEKGSSSQTTSATTTKPPSNTQAANRIDNKSSYETSFQLTNEAFHAIIKKHIQSLPNWVLPEEKELTIEIFAAPKQSQMQLQQPTPIFSQSPQQFEAQQASAAPKKMEQWRFAFHHIENTEEIEGDSVCETRVMNPHQFNMNLSILLRSILTLLTCSQMFKERNTHKVTRRVHFARETVEEDFNMYKQTMLIGEKGHNQSRLTQFSKKIYLLHHVFEFELLQRSPSPPPPQAIPLTLQQYSIYSHVNESSEHYGASSLSSATQTLINMNFSKTVTATPIQSAEFNYPDNIQTHSITNQPNQIQEQSQQLQESPEEEQQIVPEIQQGTREKSISLVQNDQASEKRQRRVSECLSSSNPKDEFSDQLDLIITKFSTLFDPYISQNPTKSAQTLLDSLLL